MKTELLLYCSAQKRLNDSYKFPEQPDLLIPGEALFQYIDTLFADFLLFFFFGVNILKLDNIIVPFKKFKK